jgi:tRNA pseudouridine38-40 synthase
VQRVSRSSNPGREPKVHGFTVHRFTVLRNLKLTIEYDGTNYVGWQRQAKGVSIQGLLEDALAPFEGGRVVLHGAGRTDAGVHALGQVANAVTSAAHDVSTLQRALNVVLPRDVRVLSVEDAAPGFHARFDAISKSYEYRIVNAPFVSAFQYRYVWHVPGTLDVDAMRAGAAAFLGRHDFVAFQAGGGHATSTIRTILSIALDPDAGGLPSLVLRVTGDGFLRHMVRAIAGTLVDIGLGRWPASHVETILAGRDRTKAGRAAPARGLFLVEVRYLTGPN